MRRNTAADAAAVPPPRRRSAAAATPLQTSTPLSPALVVASGLLSLGALAFPGSVAALTSSLDSLQEEPSLLSDFSVRFLGWSVDHRILIEAVLVGLTVGLVGSVVAGLQAKRTGEQVKLLNERLREVNKMLRERARVSTPPADDDASALAVEVIGLLRQGKQLLKQREGAAAREKFEAALALARDGNGDAAGQLTAPWKAVRKSLRGLAAASQLLGDTEAALRNMREVLALSAAADDSAGQADAVGVIADLHTQRGELDEAGVMYDRYLLMVQQM